MKNFFKMKAAEIECKLLIYTYLLTALKNKQELITLCGRLTAILSETPVEELKDKFISAMAEVAQVQENSKKTEK